jgi:hypothetical protein
MENTKVLGPAIIRGNLFVFLLDERICLYKTVLKYLVSNPRLTK